MLYKIEKQVYKIYKEFMKYMQTTFSYISNQIWRRFL